MRVVPENERLVPPYLCFICETSPVREAYHVIDTFRRYDPPAPSPLKGEKLLCERCVDEAAQLLGYVKSDDVDNANAALEAARQHLIPIQQVVVSLAKDIEQRVQYIFNLPRIDSIEKSKVVKDEVKTPIVEKPAPKSDTNIVKKDGNK